MLRLLIADGNERAVRERHTELTGQTSAQSYAEVIHDLDPDAHCTLISPADADAEFGRGAGLSGFEGVIFTGSVLRVTERSRPVMRQVELMARALDLGLPVFGSCWGVQVAAVVAGGEAGPNPKGPEYGFARRLVRVPGEGEHGLVAGRPDAWDAPAIHSDAVITPPPGARVLARNDLLDVQAIEITYGKGVFWGTQYHPELDLDRLAMMLRLSGEAVVEAGLSSAPEAVEAHAREIEALHSGSEEVRRTLAWRYGLGRDVLDAGCRRTEIANYLGRVGLAAGRRAA